MRDGKRLLESTANMKFPSWGGASIRADLGITGRVTKSRRPAIVFYSFVKWQHNIVMGIKCNQGWMF